LSDFIIYIFACSNWIFVTIALLVAWSFRKILATGNHANMGMDWIEWMFIRGEKGRKYIEINCIFSSQGLLKWTLESPIPCMIRNRMNYFY
jgi:hypothetical protein